jgi:hypothetical protein
MMSEDRNWCIQDAPARLGSRMVASTLKRRAKTKLSLVRAAHRRTP